MSAETRVYDNDHGEPVVVMVTTGTFDVSRLVHLLQSGRCEDGGLARKVLAGVQRHNGGRAALALLKAHGGADFTGPHDHCDHDPIECSHEALQGEYDELRRQHESLRSIHEFLANDQKPMEGRLQRANGEVDALRRLVADMVDDIIPVIRTMPCAWEPTDWRARAQRAIAAIPIGDQP